MVKRIILIVAIAMIAFSGLAFAGGTANVDVSARVVGTCKFLTGGSVAFGDLDPSVGTDKNGTVTQPTFWCTKGTNYTITDTGGVRGTYEMKHATLADLILYSFTYLGAGTGTGRSGTTIMNISSTVAGSDYINKSAGDYSDTVELTIIP